MPADLKKKFDIILSREQALAKSVALTALTPKPLSVWEVLIPILFILHYMKSKQDRDIFSQNLLFTKKLALEAAFAMLKNGQSKEAAVAGVDSKTKGLVSSVPDGLYSEEIRSEQMKEIDYLIDHYCKLLEADGDDYGALIVNAYHRHDNYLAYLQGLKTAEDRVTRAARQTLGSRTDTQTLSRIKAATHKARTTQAERIFNLQTRPPDA